MRVWDYGLYNLTHVIIESARKIVYHRTPGSSAGHAIEGRLRPTGTPIIAYRRTHVQETVFTLVPIDLLPMCIHKEDNHKEDILLKHSRMFSDRKGIRHGQSQVFLNIHSLEVGLPESPWRNAS